MLSIENVSFRYPSSDSFVLKELSYRFIPGKTHVLLGTNGAGKTTLLQILASLYRPTTGQVKYRQDDIFRNSASYRPRVVLIQAGMRGFYPRLSGLDNLRFTAYLKGLNLSSSHLLAVAAQVGLEPAKLKQKFQEYSLGEKQKLQLARMYFQPNDILLLDEPTAGLDAQSRRMLIESLQNRFQESLKIVVSHDKEFIEQLHSERVHLIHGKVTRLS